MIHVKSDSDDATSQASSSPRSSKRPVYYVQSPSRDSQSPSSRDSHDEDKSLTMQNTPTESPSHPSYSRHSRESSASRFSGTFRLSRGRKRNDKGWPDSLIIHEEGDDLFGDRGFVRRCKVLIGVFCFAMLFSVVCLIIWGASRPYKARVSVTSLTVHNFYYGEGSDLTGVPTRMVTMNCSMRMSVYNPATFFGIHVSSTPLNIMFSGIVVATGQLKKYYQPRKSHRWMMVNIKGNKVPLYGAGGSLAESDMSGGGVPMALVFEIEQRGNVVGKLIKSIHKRRVSCSLVVDSRSSKPIKFNRTSCTHN